MATTTIPITAVEKLNAELKSIAKTIPAEMVIALQKKITIDVFAGVIRRTPVDEGRARGGWQLSVGAPPGPAPSALVDKSEDEKSGPTFTNGLFALGKLQPFSVVFIANSIPYIVVLDQGLFVPPDPGPSKDPRADRLGKILVSGGFSIQAPIGMVDVTIESVRHTL